ncbi:MAG: nitroreductase family protein [Clostridia bacterium]|nr:nitroreductase family protein [Clostridia bacterium]
MNLQEALEKRRSIRKYKDTPVSSGILLQLAEAAKWAPNNANVQPWEFVFITEPDLLAKVSEHIRLTLFAYWSQVRVEDLPEEKLNKIVSKFTNFGPVPVYLLACIDTRAGRLKPAYKEWNDLWNHHSTACALNNLMLAAAAEGLGTCWLGVPSWNPEKLRNLLGIPEYIQVIAVSPLGYPDEAPAPPPRKPAEEYTHFNQW